MKTIRVTAPHEYEAVEEKIPVLEKDDEVLVRMAASGVCGSDFHLYHGKNPNSTYPRVPGHENAGVVADAGRKVRKVKPGDHVVIDLVVSCGECYQCRLGRRNVCENLKVRGSVVDGGWREYLVVPEDALYVVPEAVPLKYAALVEPYAIGAHCTARGKVREDDVVFVLGAGTIGSIIVQTCKAKGCTVIACDVKPEALARVKEIGADFVVDGREEDAARRVLEITGGKGATIAFDSACFRGSLTSLFAPGLVRGAGRIVSLGFETKPEEISQAMLVVRELDLIGSRLSAGQFGPTIEAFAQGRFAYEMIAGEFIPFREIDRVFHAMDNPGEGVKKMIITFD